MIAREFVLAAAAAILAAGPTIATAPAQTSNTVEFAGSMPCGDAVRAFVGGLRTEDQCHAITWRLNLVTQQSGQISWTLSAQYGVPAPANPNAMVDGPRVALAGPVEIGKGAAALPSANVYRLRVSGTQRSLAVVSVTDDLLHVLDQSNRLMVGTGGWSYTLSRADRSEKPGDPSTASDMSYTISPFSTGSAVFGVFEGRTPCRGIARTLGLADAGCLKVKWRVTLYKDPQSAAPTTYKVEGSLHRRASRQGKWRIVRGSATDPAVVVYQLDAIPDEAEIRLLKLDDNILYFLDGQKQPLVGTVDFSYTLNRTVR